MLFHPFLHVSDQHPSEDLPPIDSSRDNHLSRCDHFKLQSSPACVNFNSYYVTISILCKFLQLLVSGGDWPEWPHTWLVVAWSSLKMQQLCNYTDNHFRLQISAHGHCCHIYLLFVTTGHVVLTTFVSSNLARRVLSLTTKVVTILLLCLFVRCIPWQNHFDLWLSTKKLDCLVMEVFRCALGAPNRYWILAVKNQSLSKLMIDKWWNNPAIRAEMYFSCFSWNGIKSLNQSSVSNFKCVYPSRPDIKLQNWVWRTIGHHRWTSLRRLGPWPSSICSLPRAHVVRCCHICV